MGLPDYAVHGYGQSPSSHLGSQRDAENDFAPKAAPAGRKDDSGKLDMTLFDDMPLALEAVCEVMQWAITKKEPKPYERSSWLGISADRYRAAIMRHMSAANKQANPKPDGCPNEEVDAETNLLHLAHTACSALFALELTLRKKA